MKIKNNPIGVIYDSPSEIKRKAINWLLRIGVAPSDVDFDYIRIELWAEITFILDGKEYTFKSTKQKSFKQNLKAIEIFLHNRVINIERGIEEFETAFKGYQLLENHSINSPNNPYINLSRKEIKQLMLKSHPDTSKLEEDKIKFTLLREALDIIDK